MGGAFREIFSVAAKSLVSALFLFVLTRLLGKKQISQLSFFDYAIGISIGSLPAEIAAGHGLTLAEGLCSMALWAAIPLLFSLLSIRSGAARVLLDGTPSILVQDGAILERNLRRARFTVNDLLEELRLKDVFDIREVKFAVLETNGNLSVLKNAPPDAAAAPACCFPVVIDGRRIRQNLAWLGLDDAWLDRELKKANVPSLEHVLFAACDAGRALSVIRKDPSRGAHGVFP